MVKERPPMGLQESPTESQRELQRASRERQKAPLWIILFRTLFILAQFLALSLLTCQQPDCPDFLRM